MSNWRQVAVRRPYRARRRHDRSLNAVVAEDLPGPGTVFLETNWRFVKAVRVGETITASVKVEHVRDDKPICRLETIVRNADGQTCVVGTATTYTMPLLQREIGRMRRKRRDNRTRDLKSGSKGWPDQAA